MNRFRILNLLIVAAFVALLLWKVDLGDVGHTLRHVDVRLLLVVVALNGPFTLLYWARSRLVLASLGHRVSGRLLLPMMVLGHVAGCSPPLGRELLRTAVLRTHAGIDTEDSSRSCSLSTRPPWR